MTDSPRQQLREALEAAPVTAYVNEHTGSLCMGYDRSAVRGPTPLYTAEHVVEAIATALVEAGWGPTAAHPDQDSGLTVPSPAGVLPRRTASLAATPQHTITIGVEDGYPVMLMRCPFDMDDPERPCWSMDEVGHRDEFSTSCNWTDWWENTDDWPIEDFTIIRGVEVADWTDCPRFVALAVTIDDAGAHEPTSAQAGQSRAALQETGEPESMMHLRALMEHEDSFLNCTHDGDYLTAPDGTVVYHHGFLIEVDPAALDAAREFLARETGGPEQ